MATDLAKKVKYLQYKRRMMNRAQGIDTSIKDNSELAKWLRDLLNSGYTYDSLALLAGVSKATIINIVQRHYLHTDWKVYAQISEMDLSRVFQLAPPNTYVPAFATQRRLKALQRIGYSFRGLSDELEREGVHVLQVKSLLYNTKVKIEIHEGVKRVYDRLQLTNGGDARREAYAIRNNWAPPLAWDDIDHFESKPTGYTLV